MNNLDDIPVMPTLTLDPFGEESSISDINNSDILMKKDEKDPEEEKLSESERKMVKEFAEKIDITNTNMILQYGAGAQKKVAGFSETALKSVKTRDLGEVGDMLTNLVTDLKAFSADEKEQGGFLGIFKKANNKIANLKTKYDSAEVNVDKVSKELQKHQVKILKDIAMLDKMYELNLAYSKELTMYIIAGKQKLKDMKEYEMPKLREKARLSGSTEDAQSVNDMVSLCDRFEKKIHDLELTRMVSLQMAPQIRLVQNSNNLMAEKIQSTIVNTIPLWKNQIVLALGISHLNQAMKAQCEVSDMTNELLLKNAETLKMGTIETAKESERGIVDIDTIKKTNQSLISTIDEVVKIQHDGRIKRQEAEVELSKIENELKSKLLEFTVK
ncbi:MULTISPECIES: toxic anion resistance protein [unclassified Clostridioides]|uniref:toxic anion resistance protein n=1 Tax=unclassified Clostridioides TaxID=2635829 RepID=UPI001D0FF462|nr:toxic anion resistance protein [Clostridioides sp. ES-S-0171-01]UDN53502.1 toxic anion resistance protein [Clostridioides sp. ES-S-0054-01]